MNTDSRTSRKSLLFSALVIVLVASLGACASTSSPKAQFDDAAITTTIKGKYAADPEINPFNIDVDTNDGRVRLSGTVDDEKTRTEAVKHATQTKGVIDVYNSITVGKRAMGDKASDIALGTKVKGLLAADPEINPFNIDVDVQDAVVTLSGTVATQQAVDEAVKLSSGAKGVKRVENLLKVKALLK